MKWFYAMAGGHTHVRVFMNGAKCGDLCFRNEEFKQILNTLQIGVTGIRIQFINETPGNPEEILTR